ncbi:MAG TPA: alpha-mannosidase, partial [Myxococcota bacterium]|nr:alpha-mannosidase [Myxococcota bacterium]HVH08149.1 alpha-mannosidase [Myxococcota bacterium]
MPARHLLVVPHTHWDREWYATHEEFRYRLVRLVDRLLDILEGDPAFRCFTLDGQSIVLDDYLEVRPGARERIAKLVRDGRLLVGPWYVLPDEWLVSGEALIRNLRMGLARSAAFGPPMRLGYAPDLFGHVGQLPQLFAGFGFEAAVVWRGVPADVDQTLFDWESPDGTRLPTVYLRHGYGNAVNLPLEPRELRARIERDVSFLAPSSRIPTFLLMNGSDHVEPQAGLPAALEAALAGVPDTTFEIGTLVEFAARARAEAPADRPLHRGELRSGLRAPLLPGCASARMPQKRADFANDRALTAYLEPLAAWLGLAGGDAGCAVIEHAWRTALQNHPHDSICGCSIDP